ncbi:MAG TPA: PIN domain-containing protein [Salinisphaeraceae bacterium]|nr:PIN domain-containing protein [Salinisphaeraceae bacterium]
MATTSAEAGNPALALFVDTNVLVYANVMEAPQHQAALSVIRAAREAGRPLWISRQVLREYLALMTRPQTFANLPRTTVLEQVRLFLDQFEIADETAAVTEALCQLVASTPIGGKQTHDANLVATMIAFDIPALVTHNTKDFARFRAKIRVEGLE